MRLKCAGEIDVYQQRYISERELAQHNMAAFMPTDDMLTSSRRGADAESLRAKSPAATGISLTEAAGDALALIALVTASHREGSVAGCCAATSN